MNDDLNLTPAEADALIELLEDKAWEFVNRPYSEELSAAVRKLRALAATLPPYVPAASDEPGS